MRLTAIGLFRWDGDTNQPVLLGIATDVSSFGYFQRGAVREGIMFIARTIVQRTQPGLRQSVKNEEHFCHCHVRDTGLGGVVVCDSEYPATAAFAVISKVMEEFLQQQDEPAWRTAKEDGGLGNAILEAAIVKYQDHTQADKLAKIQRDLDDTKVVLHQTIDGVLRRGEKLDALVEKSNDLSLASQMFYKGARRTNSCCRLM